ncbi:MAG: efflux RND transporter periplasmic adaptor subunit [Minisyncoccia bacterium]
MHLPFELSTFPRWILVSAVVVVIVSAYLILGKGSDLGATLVIHPAEFRKQVSVSGTVTATRDAALGFAASGRILGTYASVGQHVGAGTILAEIENGDLVAILAQKESALAEAEANLASLRAGTRTEEIAVAAIAVTNAQAALMNAVQSAYTASDDAVHNKTDTFFTNPRTSPQLSFSVANANLKTIVERDRADIEPVLASWALLVTKLSSATIADSAKQSQVYLAKVTMLLADENIALNQALPDQTTSSATLSSYGTTLSSARISVNSAATTLTTNAAALDTAESSLALKRAGATVEAIAAQEASVASARADVRSAAASLAKTRVTAPFSGTVTRMEAKTGEIVSPTTSGIGMQSDGVFEIETYVPETVIVNIAVGNSATTTLDAYGSSISFPSRVILVDPAETVKDGVPTYKTTLAFLEKDSRIRSGMTANVLMETGILPHAIVIPAGAVGTKDGVSYVSVVTDGGASPRTVKTGSSPMLGQIEILSGLEDGDVILLAPQP